MDRKRTLIIGRSCATFEMKFRNIQLEIIEIIICYIDNVTHKDEEIFKTHVLRLMMMMLVMMAMLDKNMVCRMEMDKGILEGSSWVKDERKVVNNSYTTVDWDNCIDN